MINGIEHNGVDQADVVIRKVNHLSEQVTHGLLSVSNYKIFQNALKLCACHNAKLLFVIPTWACIPFRLPLRVQTI